MSGANLIALTDERAAQLEALLKALGPLAANMQGMSLAFVGLRDSAGNNRTLKLLVADKEDSAADGQGGGGVSLPNGGTTSQVLTKQSATDGDADWETPGGALAWRNLINSITVAGLLPTTTEINTALAATYTNEDPDLTPADGDRIILTVSSVPKFIACVSVDALTANGVFVRSFVVNSVTYYATLSECGLY